MICKPCALIAAVLFAVIAGMTIPANCQAPGNPFDTSEMNFEDFKSAIEGAFRANGADAENASTLTEVALSHWGIDPVTGEATGTIIFEWRQAHLTALWATALTVGGLPEWNLQHGLDLAIDDWLVSHNLAPMQGDDEPCTVAQLKVIYCTGDPPNEKYHETEINLSYACWSDIAACPLYIDCVNHLHRRWLMLTPASLSSECFLDSCIAVSKIPAEKQVPCDEMMNCNCFSETNPVVDCDEIETICFDTSDPGPPCPDCGE